MREKDPGWSFTRLATLLSGVGLLASGISLALDSAPSSDGALGVFLGLGMMAFGGFMTMGALTLRLRGGSRPPAWFLIFLAVAAILMFGPWV